MLWPLLTPLGFLACWWIWVPFNIGDPIALNIAKVFLFTWGLLLSPYLGRYIGCEIGKRLPLEFVRTASYNLAPISKGVYVKRHMGHDGLRVSCIQVLEAGVPLTMVVYYSGASIEFFHHAGKQPRVHIRELRYAGTQNPTFLGLYAILPARMSCRFLVPKELCLFEDETDMANN